ncbi:MAG TPA: hypothetical protein PLL77_11365 [Pyrinomonadaceae bacterium]|nr:hypothetical protein [Pyrinomonadaceae bacterium]
MEKYRRITRLTPVFRPTFLCFVNKNGFFAGIALALLAFVAIGCNAVTDGKPAAETAIGKFHAMLDDERYADIYGGLDPEFKNVTTEQEMTEILQAVHIKLGKVKSTTTQTWRANTFNLTTSIVMLQNTEFEHGKGVETFTFFFADKKVSLAGYNINSKELITK